MSTGIKLIIAFALCLEKDKSQWNIRILAKREASEA